MPFFYGANEERAIDRYYAIGSAIGRQFWESGRSALSAETGLVWLSEDLEDQTSDRRLTWSWATNYRTRVLGNIELFHSNQLLIALTDLDDSDLRADLGLKVPVVENLFTELKLEWIFDNQPSGGTEIDSELTIGLTTAGSPFLSGDISSDGSLRAANCSRNWRICSLQRGESNQEKAMGKQGLTSAGQSRP